MSTIINDIAPRNQFIATNLQTVFDASFTADIASDVTVYARATGVAADDIAQVIAAVDYTITFIGAERIVRVTFTVGRTTADIVTVSRETPTDRMNLYTNTNFTPAMLNQDFEVTTLTQQQNKLFRDKIGPQYNVSASLGLENIATYLNVTEATDLILPYLAADQLWAKNTDASSIVAIDVPAGGIGPRDATFITQTPSSDLDNEQALSALSTGFMSSTTATGVVATRTLTGTGNQIDVTNGNGGGDPVFSLSATLDTPGTFTVGTTHVVSAIINDSTQATALATNLSSALAMKTYVDGLVAVLAVGGSNNEIQYNNAGSFGGVTGANSATLVTTSAGVPAMTASMTNGQILIGSTGATPVPATLTAGAGISIAESAGGITIAGTGSGIGWTEVTGTTQAGAADSGYVINNAGVVTVTLPATAAFGTIISIVGKGAGGWKIDHGTGQNIQVGASSTTPTTGSVASTNQFDSIDLICTTADTTWTTQSGFIGSLTIV